jgi:hypothetical protein
MRRAVGVTTSDKLTSGWKEIVTVLRADDAADAAVARLGTDAKPDWAEPYVMPAFPYGNHYLGLVSLLYYVDGSDSKTGGDLQLAFSHDALKWHRPSPRRSVVAKSGDLFPCYGQCNAPLDLGDELLIYYSEADCAHPSARPRSQIRAASFRKDGFVSLGTKGDEPGALTTPPLTFTGKRLIVNAATEPGGRVRVALLDGDGNAIKGYAEEDCDVVSGTACLVGWNDERNLERFAGKPVRLRFSVRRGRLYSFRFAG